MKNKNVEILKEDEKVIIVRAKQGLTLEQFQLLSQMIKSEENETEIKVVLLPFSAELEDE